MGLNGIDISNWQNGINLAVVPCDFVICKATQGTGYISPDYNRQISQASSLGKLTGVYHYIDGSGADAEADHFINLVRPMIGKSIICLDWESEQNSQWGNLDYLDKVTKAVINRTGIPPIIYASLSVFPYDVASSNNCGTWIAQYADMNPTGYQQNPWNDFDCTIRQYASTGQLPGYSGNLDLNLGKLTAEQWMAYANPSGEVVVPTPSVPEQSGDYENWNTIDLAVKVMNGDFGNGNDRANALGSRYSEVQNLVNHIYSSDAQVLVDETWAGAYGNGDERKAVLGPRYDEVMSIINGSNSTIYVVQSGDTLSGIANKYNTTYQHLAEINNIPNPSLIYPGQRIKIG